jgi:hypothetical protein
VVVEFVLICGQKKGTGVLTGGLAALAQCCAAASDASAEPPHAEVAVLHDARHDEWHQDSTKRNTPTKSVSAPGTTFVKLKNPKRQ